MAIHNLTLSTQIQILFVGFAICLTVIMISLTNLYLYWLESEINSGSSSVLEKKYLENMRLLSKSEVKSIESFLRRPILTVKIHEKLALLAFDELTEISQPFAEFEPLWKEDCEINYIYYNTSVYMTKYSKPENGSLGYNISHNISRLNWIRPSLYDPDYAMFEGFYANEVFNLYPGKYSDEFRTYTPLIREWFNGAVINKNKIEITEPYLDNKYKIYTITVSKAIKLSDGEVLGVTAIDLSLKIINQFIKDIKIMSTGYGLLITKSGMIIGGPDSWNTDEAIKIYDEVKTGFDYETWKKIVNFDQGENFQFTDLNKTNFTMVVGLIKPYDDDDELISHYLLLAAENKMIYKSQTQLKKNFSRAKLIIFWTVLIWIIIIITVATILIRHYSTKIEVKLKAVNKIFVRFIRRAAFTGLSKKINFNKLNQCKEGIEELVQSCKEKVRDIREKNERFKFYQWVDTRPSEAYLYNEWTNFVYPFNEFYEISMKWSDNIDILEDIYLDIE